MQYQFYAHSHNLRDICRKHLHHYVQIQTSDGNHYEGYIEHLDYEHIHLVTSAGEQTGQRASYPVAIEQGNSDSRQFYPGFYPGFGYPYPYPGGFRRFILPLAALTALSVLPFAGFW